MKPTYTKNSIASLKALATALGTTESVLKDFAMRAESLYAEFQIDKSDGNKRQICAPCHDLKLIQKRINRAIFAHVDYPNYLFGGILDRDYVRNALSHKGAKALISVDVKNFFPSISIHHVKKIFKIFCKFPDDVADVLTKLTTHKGAVPQGACTSTHLANLVFFDVEHRFVKELADKNFAYSRLLDDITISATRKFKNKEVTDIIGKVKGLLKSRKFELKDSKTKIAAIENPKTLMEVTGLWLNRGHPRVKRAERDEIRTALNRCESNATVSRSAEDYHREHSSLSGRVAKLTYLKHSEAADFRNRLRKVLPIYDAENIKATKRIIRSLARFPKSDRSRYGYIDRYYKAMYRVNIVSRTHFDLAKEMRKTLSKCHPTRTKKEIIYG